MTLVQENIDLVGGADPTGVTVRISLSGARPAGYTGEPATIVGALEVTPDADGDWSAELVPNADITPAGTVYKIVLEGAGVSNGRRYISVPASGTHDVVDLLVDPPAAPASAALAVHAALRGPGGHLPDGTPADGDTILWDAGMEAFEYGAGAGGGGAPTDATYLTATANDDLSDEIVVGTTPGGELGGTWASPTVDATHSGSSHASVQAAAEATAAADATTKANAAQAAAVQRANHTGTQSADTITDGTTNKAFLATERTKLAGIETGATADQTAAELLTAIKTVDGAGSGLDADLLDGLSSAAFATQSALDAEATTRGVADNDLASMVNDLGDVVSGLSSTYGRLVSGVYSLESFGSVDLTGAVDATATLNAALAAMYAAGGGTLLFPEGSILIAGQVIIPNDGGGIFATDAQLQPSMVWRGTGAGASGQLQGAISGGTRLVCTFDGATYNNAQFVTRGLGQWEITGITFHDSTADPDTPFIYTTNTTLKIHHCAFLGSQNGGNTDKDAIVLGGTTKKLSSDYDDADSAFQGYGTVISECYFDRVRRAVYGRSYCNAVIVRDNFLDKDCGAATYACIEFNGALDLDGAGGGHGDYCTSNHVIGNYLNGLYPQYQVKLVKATRCLIGWNYSPDTQPNLTAFCRLEGVNAGGTDYYSYDNLLLQNLSLEEPATHVSADAMSALKNIVLGGGNTEQTVLTKSVRLQIGTQRLVIATPDAVSNFSITDEITEFFKVRQGGHIDLTGIVNVIGSTTTLNIGNNSVAASSTLNMNAPSGQVNQVQFKRAGSNSWLFYDANSTSFFFRDSVNGVMHLTLNPGSASTGRIDLGVKLRALATAGIEMGSGGPLWRAGTGSPEGAVTAPIGSLWTRTDGGAATTLYVKESGAGNTGWVAK